MKKKNVRIFVIICLVILMFVELHIAFCLLNGCVGEHINYAGDVDKTRIFIFIKLATYIIIIAKNSIEMSVIASIKSE